MAVLLLAGLLTGCLERRTSLESARVERATPPRRGNPSSRRPPRPPGTRPATTRGAGVPRAAAADADEIGAADLDVILPGSIAGMIERVRASIAKANAREPSQTRDSEVAVRNAILARLQSALRPARLELSLAGCIRRALDHNLSLKIDGYNPAISVTQIVEAEAVFDAVYFLEANYLRQDTPVASELQGAMLDRRSLETGFRKLLAAGTQVRTSYVVNRTFTDLAFVTLNPAYDNDLVFEVRQPLLRGFGIDFNRTNVNAAKFDRDAKQQRFRRQVRDVLVNVERTYWDLMQAKVDLTIQVDLALETADILVRFILRGDYDAMPIQIERIKSTLSMRIAEFVRLRDRVKEVEDTLKNLLNDPELGLATDVELIPTDVPLLSSVLTDPEAANRSALKNRSEIKEARLGARSARLQIHAARNQALPLLDLSVRMTENGLGQDADRAFDELTKNDFVDWFVGLSLEIPLGNREAKAKLRRAKLQYYQAVAAVKKAQEDIIFDVRKAQRDMGTAYEQIAPTREGIVSARKNIDALWVRATTMSPDFLDLLLNSLSALATNRRGFFQAVAAYNTSIANLERAKGTLLKYNNVGISEETYGTPER